MQVHAYLNFDGRCKEAFRFYEQALGGKVTAMQTFGESPMAGDMPPEARDRVIHAVLKVGDTVLMASDAPPDRYEKPQGLWISVSVDRTDEADRIFQALSEKGNVVMPIQETFWSPRFGMTYDRYGIPWMVNTNQPA